ncbi:MAG: hypothetical protein IKI68_01965, partial [Clostridia bacterium]|nr:hypothetical protein [Clostridia bacterium]
YFERRRGERLCSPADIVVIEKVLASHSRLYDAAKKEHDDEIASDRRSQVGSGDRSERIRTYNFPQGRVTDHRIGLTLYKLEAIMNGDLDEIIDGLITYYRTEALKEQNS